MQAAGATADNSAVYNNGSDLYAEIGTGKVLVLECISVKLYLKCN